MKHTYIYTVEFFRVCLLLTVVEQKINRTFYDISTLCIWQLTAFRILIYSTWIRFLQGTRTAGGLAAVPTPKLVKICIKSVKEMRIEATSNRFP